MTIRRVCIKGLPSTIEPKDIGNLFGKFGSIKDIFVAMDGFERATCRGFAFVTVEFDEVAWTRCMSVLNHSIWHDRRITIEEVRRSKSFMDKYEVKAITPETHKMHRKRRLTRMCSNTGTVTAQNFNTRKGWKLGRSGLPVPVLKLHYPRSRITLSCPLDNGMHEVFSHEHLDAPVFKLTWLPDSLPSFQNNHVINCLEVSGTSNGFSLAQAVNLPVIPIKPILGWEGSNEPTHPQLNKSFIWPNLFFNFLSSHPLLSLPKARGNLHNTIDEWKSRRSEIRKDFRSQIKSSKRK